MQQQKKLQVDPLLLLCRKVLLHVFSAAPTSGGLILQPPNFATETVICKKTLRLSGWVTLFSGGSISNLYVDHKKRTFSGSDCSSGVSKRPGAMVTHLKRATMISEEK